MSDDQAAPGQAVVDTESVEVDIIPPQPPVTQSRLVGAVWQRVMPRVQPPSKLDAD